MFKSFLIVYLNSRNVGELSVTLPRLCKDLEQVLRVQSRSAIHVLAYGGVCSLKEISL